MESQLTRPSENDHTEIPIEVHRTGQSESQSHPVKDHIPAPEEIVPPGTKVFPAVSPDQTEHVEPERLSEPEPVHGDLRTTSHAFEGLTHPTRVSDLSDREESRVTPVSLLSGTEDVTKTFVPSDEEDPLGQRKVNLERPKGLEEDPAAPGGGFGSSGVVSNYQCKVTDPTGKSGEEVEVSPMIESLGKIKVADVTHEITGPGLEREFPTRSNEHNVKLGHEMGQDLPSKSHELDVKSGHEHGKGLLTGSHERPEKEMKHGESVKKESAESIQDSSQ